MHALNISNLNSARKHQDQNARSQNSRSPGRRVERKLNKLNNYTRSSSRITRARDTFLARVRARWSFVFQCFTRVSIWKMLSVVLNARRKLPRARARDYSSRGKRREGRKRFEIQRGSASGNICVSKKQPCEQTVTQPASQPRLDSVPHDSPEKDNSEFVSALDEWPAVTEMHKP